MTTLKIFTLALNAEPYIERHLKEFEKLPFPWVWHIREGQAANVQCTRWCKALKPSLSTDGTHEYLKSISKHPNVRVFSQSWWSGGKVQMCNDVLRGLKEPAVLLQCDSDEMWSADQLEMIVRLFDENPPIGRMEFFCKYFVGPDIVTVGENCYGNNPGEWRRAWRFEPGMLFATHEPPELNRSVGNLLDRNATREFGLVFDHFSWVDDKIVKFKLNFYNYGPHYYQLWKKLQYHKEFPTKLKSFMPWVDNDAMATRIHESRESISSLVAANRTI